MAATTTYLGTQKGSVSPVRSGMDSLEKHYINVAMDAAYATGGEAITLPTEVKGKKLVFVNVLTPLGGDVDGNTLFHWNGSATAPLMMATLISTGAEASGDLSGFTSIICELGFRS